MSQPQQLINNNIDDKIINDIDSESEDEYEYENYGTQPDGSYLVAGGGMMNGNAYATIERKNDKYYYCEYGRCASRQYIGDTITWSEERQNDGCRAFNID